MSSILEESKKSRGAGKFKITKKKIIILIIILSLVSAYFYINKKDTKESVVSQKEWIVKKDNLKISIESDGKVVAEDGVELSFSVSGTNLEVEEVFIKEGDKIKKGDKIATVETETLELNVRSAYSSYSSALADYNQTIDGATKEQIADAQDSITSAEILVEQSKISLADTKQSAADNIREAQNNLDDNQDILTSEDIRDAYEDLVDNIKAANISLGGILKDSDEILGIDDARINDDYEDLIGVKNFNYLNQAKHTYLESSEELEELNVLAMNLNIYSDYSFIDEAASQAEDALTAFENHLYYIRETLDASITSGGLTQTQLNAFVSTINTDRTTVNTKITTLNTKVKAVSTAKDNLEDYIIDYENAIATAERDIDNAKAILKSKELNLDQAKRDYHDLIAPLTESEKAFADSSLTSASVSLEKAQNELENATIFSPINGEVARLNYKTGDIIVDNSNSDPVAVIINNDTLFIEVDIEEADINKIKIGQSVYATFDAVDDLILDGEVDFISLTSKTNSSGIVTYLVRIAIMNKEDIQIREGMTVFVDFIIAEAKNVLVVPVSAVKNINDIPSVLDNNKEWIPITTGFTDGKNVEIISGLNAGDKIVY